MTKDEALKMAINLLETLKNGKENFEQSNIHIVCDCCNLALNTKWQGLSDDEVDDLMYQYCDTDNGYSIKSLIKLVEERLERRNNHDTNDS